MARRMERRMERITLTSSWASWSPSQCRRCSLCASRKFRHARHRCFGLPSLSWQPSGNESHSRSRGPDWLHCALRERRWPKMQLRPRETIWSAWLRHVGELRPAVCRSKSSRACCLQTGAIGPALLETACRLGGSFGWITDFAAGSESADD